MHPAAAAVSTYSNFLKKKIHVENMENPTVVIQKVRSLANSAVIFEVEVDNNH